MKRAISGKSGHISFLTDCQEWLARVRVKNDAGTDVTRSVKCINGWRVSISAVLNLWSDLNQNHDFKFLFTRRLNQDPLENFFSVIRQKGGSCDNPTPLDFMRLFRQVCCRQLLNPSTQGNSEVDLSDMLATISKPQVCMKRAFETVASAKIADCPLPVNVLPKDCARECLEENGLFYVCGYLLRKLLKWHSCLECDLLHDLEMAVDSKTEYLQQRTYSSSLHVGLFAVNEHFFDYVRQCENIFQSMFRLVSHEKHVAQKIVTELAKVQIPVTCMHFPQAKFLQFFVRLRIYYTLKFQNRNAKQKKPVEKKHKKLSKLSHT